MLLGIWRGIVYEVLSLLGWVAAFFAARWFATDVAAVLPIITSADLRIAMAYALLFIATLLLSGFVAWLLSKIISKLGGLGWSIRVLGAIFGALRGAMLVLVLVLIGGLTPWPKDPVWRDAKLSQPLEDWATASLVWLPEGVANHIRY